MSNVSKTYCAFCKVWVLDFSVRAFFERCIKNKFIFKINKFLDTIFFKNLLELTATNQNTLQVIKYVIFMVIVFIVFFLMNVVYALNYLRINI
ncbi:hypothetical protein SAMN05421856_10958 [Chryseobacterium taichungense]|uniref:Uncharacterized protein n=1 Tax=Chryseobacterium taichungense TaxID=295069 RepID=A0A1H8CGF0_9FLAO|nr:hypothetical protein SAMN05421856_10958 [Chryseobacterium taichungense]